MVTLDKFIYLLAKEQVMQAETDLRARVEAVQMLKAQYYVGSREAFSYLKVSNEYSRLADETAESLNILPSVKESANICDFAKAFFNAMLDSEAAKRSLEMGRASAEYFVLSYPKAMQAQDKQDAQQCGGIILEFDYKCFFLDYFANFSLHRNHDRAMRQATLAVRQGTVQYFRFNGKSYSYQEIVSSISLPDAADNKYFDRNLEMHKITDADDFLAQFEIEQTTGYEGLFLLGMNYFGEHQGLYERAEREKKLGYLDVERRIALNQVSIYGAGSGQDIESCLRDTKQRLSKELKRNKQLEELNAPSVILNHQKKYVEKLRYLVRALVTNKKWLQKILAEE